MTLMEMQNYIKITGVNIFRGTFYQLIEFKVIPILVLLMPQLGMVSCMLQTSIISATCIAAFAFVDLIGDWQLQASPHLLVQFD